MLRIGFLLIMLLVVVLFIIGIICLQIFLSKSNNKWVGLILPFITFLYSILMILNIRKINGSNIWLTVGITFIFFNLSTAILLGIYFAYRHKYNKQAQFNKMNIQDL